MTQHEGQREDLIRTATALVQRVELAIDGFPDLLVIGFRRDGAASLFVGEDPVYQFNARGELRRAFQAGKPVKAESGRLVELTRQRADNRVAMLPQELTDLQQDQFVVLELGISTHLNDHLLRQGSGISRITERQRAADRDIIGAGN